MPNFAQEDKFKLQDSGERAIYKNSAQRDLMVGRGRFELISPFALLRLARVYEKGVEKYPVRNWEVGMPFSRFIDSALRHLTQYIMGMRDEDHLAQAAWHLFALMHHEEVGLDEEFDDMPRYMTEHENKGEENAKLS